MGRTAASKRRGAALWRTAVLPKATVSSLASVLLLTTLGTAGFVRADRAGASIVSQARGSRASIADLSLRTLYAKGVPFCRKPSQGKRSCFAMRRVEVSRGTPGAESYTVRATPAPGPAGGLTPAELATAYGYSTAGGKGQTVAIVDAYNDPNIVSDLGTFDSHYRLTACTQANGCL